MFYLSTVICIKGKEINVLGYRYKDTDMHPPSTNLYSRIIIIISSQKTQLSIKIINRHYRSVLYVV